MFRFTRRTRVAEGVRFCDSCAEVTTADQRAAQHYARARAHWPAFGLPR
ncbi:hypothetical protein KZ829_36320 [Actinoplanes hulinensis]|uniref:Uncharacterized protein n=1 Tax=Actinoplanes hulinensis TaxID=1144547 RepID=A0ABS7BEA7_9ACTN|nr:hypothetical protein [Actinoplanes hulinensis]MBW6439204.1 hypothetical protein [Actinoplanes hulinensis]